MSRNQWIDIQDCPYSGKILIFIDDKKQITIGELQQFVNSYTAREIIELFKKHNLVIIEEKEKPRRTINIKLTEKGIKITNFYRKILSIQKGEMDPENNSCPTATEILPNKGEV